MGYPPRLTRCTSSPDPANDPTGDVALGRVMQRFVGREHLLLEESVNFIEFLEVKLGIRDDSEACRQLINEFLEVRQERLGIE